MHVLKINGERRQSYFEEYRGELYYMQRSLAWTVGTLPTQLFILPFGMVNKWRCLEVWVGKLWGPSCYTGWCFEKYLLIEGWLGTVSDIIFCILFSLSLVSCDRQRGKMQSKPFW